MITQIKQLVAEYRRRSFFRGLSSDYAKLGNDLTNDELLERDMWDATSADGLDDDHDGGRPIPTNTQSQSY